MFRVVTVEREYGAGGSFIARRVAVKLGWNLWDRALVEAVADDAQVDYETAARYDERVDAWWHRFHRSGLWSAAIVAGIAPKEVRFLDAESMAVSARQVIAAAAAAGDCVIVGRGAQCVLQGRADIFHVFIYGPWGERVSRVRSCRKSSEDVAETIRLTDNERAHYIRTYYGFDWKDPHLYNMMISSDAGLEKAADAIVDAVRRSKYPFYAACRIELHV